MLSNSRMEVSFHEWSMGSESTDVATSDRSGGLWSPAIVLPEQLCSRQTHAEAHRGEVALMHAVLADAVACFQQQASFSYSQARQLAKEASQWIFTNDADWPFSFVNICAVLGLEPEHIRCGLRLWRQRRAEEKSSPTAKSAVPASRLTAA